MWVSVNVSTKVCVCVWGGGWGRLPTNCKFYGGMWPPTSVDREASKNILTSFSIPLPVPLAVLCTGVTVSCTEYIIIIQYRIASFQRFYSHTILERVSGRFCLMSCSLVPGRHYAWVGTNSKDSCISSHFTGDFVSAVITFC